MMNLLATGLVSICLLSPVQSPGCAGDIGVSTPFASIHASLAPQTVLPIPVVPAPAPSVPPVVKVPAPPAPPAQTPVSVPSPVQAQPIPAAPTAAPAPASTVVPAPVESSETFVPVAPAVPASPTPSTSPSVEPSPVPSTPAPHHIPPFGDGSVGSAIGNTVFQFPDLLWLAAILAGLGIAVLVERLDEHPRFKGLLKKGPAE